MNRLCIFAHFDKDCIVDDYVITYLQSLRNVCGCLVFVTTSALPGSELSKINGICDNIILRENAGYDFMSYKTALQYLESESYDEVMLCNDSVYGPLFPLDKIFMKMQEQECDFWGITENHEIAYHIQSYFIVFRKTVLQSQCFKDFWSGVTIKKNKQHIIEEYEIGLSQTLINNGFSSKAYTTYQPSSIELLVIKQPSIKKVFNPRAWVRLLKLLLCPGKERKINPTHLLWRELIKKKNMPFIKIELLRDNPIKINIKNYEEVIQGHTNYDIKLLRGHLGRVQACSDSKAAKNEQV